MYLKSVWILFINRNTKVWQGVRSETGASAGWLAGWAVGRVRSFLRAHTQRLGAPEAVLAQQVDGLPDRGPLTGPTAHIHGKVWNENYTSAKPCSHDVTWHDPRSPTCVPRACSIDGSASVIISLPCPQPLPQLKAPICNRTHRTFTKCSKRMWELAVGFS